MCLLSLKISNNKILTFSGQSRPMFIFKEIEISTEPKI